MAESSDSNVELVLIVIVVLILVFVVPIIVVIVPIPIVVIIRDDDSGHLDHMTDVCSKLYAIGRDKLDLMGGNLSSRHVLKEEFDLVTVIILLQKTSRERNALTKLLSCGWAGVDKAEDDHSEDQHDSAHDVTSLSCHASDSPDTPGVGRTTTEQRCIGESAQHQNFVCLHEQRCRLRGGQSMGLAPS